MYKYSIILLLLLTTVAQAEMKCEAGKCSSGKDIPKKEIPIKETIKKDTSSTKKMQVRENRPTVKQLFNVRTVKVLKKETARQQINYGYIVADESLKYDIVAWYSGFVEKLHADTLYTKVQKGDILAKVYSPEVYKAKQDYLNSIKFNAQRPSPSMVKSSKIKLELLNVNSQEIDRIRTTGKVEKFTTIYAPVSGWIFEKNINQGSAFNSSKKLFQIVSLKKVWMEVKLYQNELEKLHTFKNFTVKTKGINETFQATKSLFYPTLNPKEATATLRLEIDNSKHLLKPGMYAKMYASADSRSNLVIPRTAAMRKNGQWYAFLATEFKGEYEPAKIELKPLDNKYFEIISGLNEGDSVVNNALFMMDSDAQINSIY